MEISEGASWLAWAYANREAEVRLNRATRNAVVALGRGKGGWGWRVRAQRKGQRRAAQRARGAL